MTVLASALVVMIVAELGYLGWYFIGKPNSRFAAYTPHQATAVAVQSLQNAKIDGGFLFQEATGTEINLRTQRVESGSHYLTAAFNYHNYRITRLSGVNEREEAVGAIVGMLANGSLSTPVFEVPVSPEANCTIEDHIITCGSEQRLNLATVTASVDHGLGVAGEPISNTTAPPAAASTAPTPAASAETEPTASVLNSKPGTAFTYDPDYASAVHYPLAIDDPQVGDFSATSTGITAQGVDLTDSVETDSPLWVFAYPGRTTSWWPGSSKDTVNHILVTPTKLVAVMDGVRAWEYQPAAGFAELNTTDTNPKITLVGSTLVFATNDGIIGLDANTGEVVWSITTTVESWAVDAGYILVTNAGNLSTFDLATQAYGRQEYALTPTLPDPQNAALPLEAFRDGTYEVPRMGALEDMKADRTLAFESGQVRTPRIEQGVLMVLDAKPIFHAGTPYTLVWFMWTLETAHQHHAWGIYDINQRLVASFDFNDLENITDVQGEISIVRIGQTRTFGDVIEIGAIPTKVYGDRDAGMGCNVSPCSLFQTLRIRWNGNDFTSQPPSLVLNDKPLAAPQLEHVQALLDAWAFNDPERARPYVDDLDSFMSERNQCLGDCTTYKNHWADIIFDHQGGKVTKCVLPPPPFGLTGSAGIKIAGHTVLTSDLQPGDFICLFDAAGKTHRESQEFEADWLVVTTDEKGHITNARFQRSYS